MEHCLEKLWKIICVDIQTAHQGIVDLVQHILTCFEHGVSRLGWKYTVDNVLNMMRNIKKIMSH